MLPVRGRIGRVREQDEGRRLGEGHREGIVQHQAVHAPATSGDGVGACGDLVSLALPVPLYGDEALGLQLLLGGRGIILRAGWAPPLAIEVGIGVEECRRGVVEAGGLRIGGIAGAWVLEDAKVSGRDGLDAVRTGIVIEQRARTWTSCAAGCSRKWYVPLPP